MPTYDLEEKYASSRGLSHLRSRCSRANTIPLRLFGRRKPFWRRTRRPTGGLFLHMLSRNRINRVGGLFYRTITPCASDFHGSLTIANNVNLRPITKVTCGAWRPIVTTAMRLVYTSEVRAVECISVLWSHPFCRCRFSPPLNPCRGYRLL